MQTTFKHFFVIGTAVLIYIYTKGLLDAKSIITRLNIYKIKIYNAKWEFDALVSSAPKIHICLFTLLVLHNINKKPHKASCESQIPIKCFVYGLFWIGCRHLNMSATCWAVVDK